MDKRLTDVAGLRELWSSYRQARVLITAANCRIFDHLASYRSAREIAGLVNTDPRATEILLDALTGLTLLEKEGGRYINTPFTSTYLVSTGPLYQGDMIQHNDTMWKSWSCLDTVLKTGKPAQGVTFYHRAFILAMHNVASVYSREVFEHLNLEGVKSFLDLGGGPGSYTMAVARRGIATTLVDAPETIEIARELAEKAGIEGITFVNADFLTQDIGSGYDLAFISHILHAYSEETNLAILKKAKESLNPKGRVVIQEFHLEEDGTLPLESALFSVNMLVNTQGGRCYAPGRMRQWLEALGFGEIRQTVLSYTVLLEGRAKD